MATKFNLFSAQGTKGAQREAIYNALDCITTLEIDNVLEARMTEQDKRTHDFYMAIQGPAVEMGMRGIRVDESAKERLKADLFKRKRKVLSEIQQHPLVKPIWDKLELNTGACMKPSRKDGKHKWPRATPDMSVIPDSEKHCVDCNAPRLRVRPFLPSSPDDVKHLLYDLYKMKEIRDKDGKVTTDKEARERLSAKYPKYEPVIALLNEEADVGKQIGFLGFRSDDGRFYSNFNVGVTNTHRFSSNSDNYGRGGNAQNITEKHRHIFTADPGYELCYADLKQAESKVISFVAGDEEYIAAHEGGDTHTFVCRLVWPEGIKGVPWTGDLAADKVIASGSNPTWDDRPGHDFRFQSKSVQHGSNLGLTPFGMAIQKRIPVEAAREGQHRYFSAFPGIRDYQRMIRQKVQDQEPIITPLGVRFKLYGRPKDEHTYKQGLAVIPQSMVGHIISIALWRMQRYEPLIQLLAQVHDAILFQFPKGRYDILYRVLTKHMVVPIPITGTDGKTRVMTIGTEAAVGHNWGHGNNQPFDKEGKPKTLNTDGIFEITFTSPTEWKIKS
jgi:DNA polymerase I-like protein with 3'-5' exonuclease and polymerase domains